MRLAAAFMVLASASTVQAETIIAPDYVEPTTRYAHAILGDNIEHAGLCVTLANGAERIAVWSELVVF